MRAILLATKNYNLVTNDLQVTNTSILIFIRPKTEKLAIFLGVS